MTFEPYPAWNFDIPEFLNIGVACTSKHLGTAKEDNLAMIIEDTHLGTSQITYKELARQSDFFEKLPILSYQLFRLHQARRHFRPHLDFAQWV